MGRIFSIVSIILGSGLGLLLESASQAFNLLLMIGSGTGLIYILRWFWWRINAYTEIIAMVASLVIALILSFFIPNLEDWQKISLGAILTTSIWLIAVYFTPKEDEKP